MMDGCSIGEAMEGFLAGLGDDCRRHDRKVLDAIAHNLVDMVSDDAVMVSDGRRVIKVPLPQFSECRIRFADGDPGEGGGSGAKSGEGDGEAHPLAVASKEGAKTPGVDIRETTVDIEDIERTLFDDLILPGLDTAKIGPGSASRVRFAGLARTGIISHWDKKATLLANLRRTAAAGVARYSPLSPEDLRFRVADLEEEEAGGAVVLAMMDTSGSMGVFEKYLAKSFFFWTAQFLRSKYPQVDIVFLAHDVRAREVDEDTFFHRGASGGTVSSSVYRLGEEILGERYPRTRYNAYAFHFTDGGNLTSDNQIAVDAAVRLAGQTVLFGYGEIHDSDRGPSPLYQGLSGQPGVGVCILRGRQDVFAALHQFFGRDREERISADSG